MSAEKVHGKPVNRYTETETMPLHALKCF